MDKTVSVPEKQQSGPELQESIRFATPFDAAMQMLARTCDGLAGAASEPSAYIRKALTWWPEHTSALPAGMKPAILQVPGKFAAIDYLAAFAREGKRLAFAGSSRTVKLHGLDRAAGTPMVLLISSDRPGLLTGGACFQLCAATAQQAADLSVIAQRISEYSLLPGVVLLQAPSVRLRQEPFTPLSGPQLSRFLGAPDEELPCPTENQKKLFGATRPRIPRSESLNAHDYRDVFEQDLPNLIKQTFAAFAELTGREYTPIRVDEHAGESVFIAPAMDAPALRDAAGSSGQAPTILSLTQLVPLPAAELLKALRGRKQAIILTRAKRPERSQLKEKLQLLLAQTSGRGKNRTLPALKAGEKPVLRVAHTSPGALSSTVAGRLFEEAVSAADIFSVQISVSDRQLEDTGTATTIAVRSTSPHQPSGEIAAAFAHYFNIKPGLFLESAQDLSLLTLPFTDPDDSPAAQWHMLVREDFDINTLEDDLQHLAENGIVLFLQPPQSAQRLWKMLAPDTRRLLQEKELRLFFLPGQEKKAADAGGRILGGLLALLLNHPNAELSSERIDKVLDAMTSNGSIAFAQSIRSGIHDTIQIDLQELLEIDAQEVTLPQPDIFLHEEPVAADAPSLSPDQLRELRLFYLTGKRPASSFDDVPEGPLLPVHLAGLTDLDSMRYTYPVVLEKDPRHPPVRSLSAIFDDIIASGDATGDQAELRRRDLLRIEVAIKHQLRRHPEANLATLLDYAISALLPPEDSTAQDRLNTLADELKNKGFADQQVLECNRESAFRIPAHLLQTAWQERTRELRIQAEEYAFRLEEILKADEYNTADAATPEHMRAALGSADADAFDMEAMSELVRHTASGPRLDPARRQRISAALKKLRRGEAILQPGFDNSDEHPAAALGKMQARMRQILGFFRAMQIARLEIANKYDPERHDAYFADFSVLNLSESETAALPPLLLHVKGEALDTADRESILAALAGDLPIKIVLTWSEALQENPAAAPEEHFRETISAFARMAVALENACVVQTTASQLPELISEVNKSLLLDSPALFAIFTGEDAGSALSGYLYSAAALESRTTPACFYHPAAGTTLAERYNIGHNPAPDKTWPVNTITFRNSEDETQSLDYAFTPADFLSIGREFSRHFLPVRRSAWTDRMILLADFLALHPQERHDKLPYILLAAPDGTLYRVLITQDVVLAVYRLAMNWRQMQELGGINNSFVLRAAEELRKQFEQEKQQALAEQKAAYEKELERSISAVAEELVSNIAAGLLGQSTAAPALPRAEPQPASASPPPAIEEKPAPAPEAPTEQAEEDEPEEESLTLDEAWIETPRCTSCNECINRNNLMFAYDENKQAYIKDVTAGTFRDLVESAENCPVKIIHPGKPINPDEPGLDELIKRAEAFQ